MNQYNRLIEGIPFLDSDGTRLDGLFVDVYDVLKAFNVTCPALQHLIKKALNTGNRGHKDLETDLQDIIDSAIRAKALNHPNL
jgi:hypothetical protein